jgi:predicted nucleic acid-binding protein
MSLLIADSSVGVKWFLPEVYQADAQRLQNPAHQLHAPTLFDVEVANALWKKIRRGTLTRAEADAVLVQLPLLPLTRHAEAPLLPLAFDLANQTQRTVYDCLYLALATQLGGRMVTADQKLYNALATTPWAAQLCWVENVP